MTAKKNKTFELPEVNFSEDGESRYLHLGTPWIQGAMKLKEPFELELEYIQRMMAWLLFIDPAGVAKRQALQLGLGAASLTKFCHKELRMKTTAIELNPQVIGACRSWFALSADDDRLSVVLGDAAEVVAHTYWRGQIDVLHVDLYDHEAAAPVLDDADFYAQCRQLLTAQGCMVVNLFGRSSSYDKSLAHIAQAFGQEALWVFKPTKEGNTVVLALRTAQHPTDELLQARAAEIQKRWGQLDILVNNAGIAGPTAAIEDTSLHEWQQTLDVNLTGAFLCTRSAVPLIKKAKGGSIINISSAAGRHGFPLRSPYSATKFGVIGLTQTWAMELGPSGIRVNAILPGIVEGARQDRVLGAKAETFGISLEAMRTRALERVSLRRMVSAQDIAAQIVFICSKAGAKISGQSLSVDGNVETLVP